MFNTSRVCSTAHNEITSKTDSHSCVLSVRQDGAALSRSLLAFLVTLFPEASLTLGPCANSACLPNMPAHLLVEGMPA